MKYQPDDYYYQGYYNKYSLRRFFYKSKFAYVLKKINEDSKTGKRLLDLGCGNGVFLKLAQEHGFNVFGIDNNLKFLCVANKLIGENKTSQQDIRCFSLDRKFDIITCLDVMEHFPEKDLEVVFYQISTHLKKGGKLIITYPSFLYLRIIEPIWKYIRSHLYNSTFFLDQDRHALLSSRMIQNYTQKYSLVLQEKSSIVNGLLEFLKFTKKR